MLPYERSAVEQAREEYEKRPDTRMHKNYGPDGTALLAASRAGHRFTLGIGVIGVFIYIASGFRGVGASVSYVLLALAMALASLGVTRALQASAAGKRFRGGRPYVRRADRTF